LPYQFFFAGWLLAREFPLHSFTERGLGGEHARGGGRGVDGKSVSVIELKALLLMRLCFIWLQESGCGTYPLRNPQSTILQESVNQTQFRILPDWRRMRGTMSA